MTADGILEARLPPPPTPPSSSILLSDINNPLEFNNNNNSAIPAGTFLLEVEAGHEELRESIALTLCSLTSHCILRMTPASLLSNALGQQQATTINNNNNVQMIDPSNPTTTTTTTAAAAIPISTMVSAAMPTRQQLAVLLKRQIEIFSSSRVAERRYILLEEFPASTEDLGLMQQAGAGLWAIVTVSFTPPSKKSKQEENTSQTTTTTTNIEQGSAVQESTATIAPPPQVQQQQQQQSSSQVSAPIIMNQEHNRPSMVFQEHLKTGEHPIRHIEVTECDPNDFKETASKIAQKLQLETVHSRGNGGKSGNKDEGSDTEPEVIPARRIPKKRSTAISKPSPQPATSKNKRDVEEEEEDEEEDGDEGDAEWGIQRATGTQISILFGKSSINIYYYYYCFIFIFTFITNYCYSGNNNF